MESGSELRIMVLKLSKVPFGLRWWFLFALLLLKHVEGRLPGRRKGEEDGHDQATTRYRKCNRERNHGEGKGKGGRE